MDVLDRHRVTIGRFAWWMAWVGLVGGQLHALSRFATEDGKEDLELSLTAAWAVPAADILQPLLSWSDPVEVYISYGKLWLFVFIGFTLCAFVVRRSRQPRGFEKWAWRIALTGYVIATLGVFGDYWTQWGSDYNWFLDIAFGITVVGLLVTLLGSTLLGISLLRTGFRPRLAAWLLVLALPWAFAVLQVTSLGSVVLSVAFGFGVIGRQLAKDAETERVTVPQPAQL
jgi:hypothetical protein